MTDRRQDYLSICENTFLSIGLWGVGLVLGVEVEMEMEMEMRIYMLRRMMSIYRIETKRSEQRLGIERERSLHVCGMDGIISIL